MKTILDPRITGWHYSSFQVYPYCSMQCPACKSSTLTPLFDRSVFVRCKDCYHSVRTEAPAPTTMVNAKLDLRDIEKPDGLTKFMVDTVRNLNTGNSALVDVGCGTGKFLYHVQSLFNSVFGIEVSKECVEFIRNELKLSVGPSVPQDIEEISCVTAWHALEHLRFEDSVELLKGLQNKFEKNSKIVIAVPNGDSFFGFILPRYFAFYDQGEHHHQFSVKSLEKLLELSGYSVSVYLPSAPYTIFAVIQSGLNLITRSHNYLYYRLKRGQINDSSKLPDTIRMVLHLALAPLIALILAPLILFEILFPKNSSSIVVTAKSRVVVP